MDSNNDKIDFEQIRDLFNLKNQLNFEFYVENIFPDLCTFDKKKNLGVSKVKFFDFMKLPIFICEKLFTTMDKNKDNFLSMDEFIKPLSKLYFGEFEETAQIIFQIYDFDQDNYINQADVKMVLSYLPLITDETGIEYIYQMESLLELDDIIKNTFKNQNTLKIDEFIAAIQLKSDIYLQLICYFYKRCPFQEKSISVASKSSSKSLKKMEFNSSLYSKEAISSPKVDKVDSGDFEDNELKLTNKKSSNKNITLPSPSNKTRFSPASDFFKKVDKDGGDDDEEDVKKKPKRKFDSFSSKESLEMSGYKGMIRHSDQKEVAVKSRSSFKKVNDKEIAKTTSFEKINEVDEEEKDNKPLVVIQEVDDNNKDVIFEGPIMKTSKKANGVKIFFMSIIGEDIYSYTDETKSEFKHMHNLNGCFIKENGEEKVANVVYYSFSIIFVNKTRTYYLKERSLAKEWTKSLRIAIGYKNFFDFYEMLDDLGEGQFGLVKLGVNIKTKEKVAIKIIKKSKMKPIEAGLVKNEINVLQVCRHPHIVQFLDHFENSEYIFIVMEYIKYGHLREYLTKKNFNISEKIASKIASQIASALKYLHSFGVIHRDLKPDNVMVFDSSKEFQVKIMDFGLSKILGPKEKTLEGYGTLCFVAPEIILRDPYNNSVDIWSLGIMIYYIMSGDLPFDDCNNHEKTIAKKIVYEELRFPELKWNSKSKELKHFISQCLIKDLKKRITIDKLVEHDWIKLNEN